MDALLASDAASVANLCCILDHLSASPSSHLHKSAARVTALMHSKDPAARWAAICIAYRMSSLSLSVLTDNAQSWVGIILPSLSKPAPIPILRASMRYLTLVLCAAGHNLEFQRQVAIPIVPKVGSALLSIAEQHGDRDIKISSIRALAQLIPLYPSLHKALSQRLFALCNQTFSSSVCNTTNALLDATVNLYAVLHFLAGKVGGTGVWRACLDEVLQFSWSAWLALRTTFPTSAQLSHKVIGHLRSADRKLPSPLLHTDAVTGNPLTVVALNLDRLKCGVSAIGALLGAPINRPVRIPIGHVATLCWCLLASTPDDEGQTYFDPHIRTAESAVIPQIWMQACRLLSCLAQTTRDLLSPHTSKLIMVIASHLEDNLGQSEKQSFLLSACDLLYFCPVVGATVAINRLLKAAISILSPLYIDQPRTETTTLPTTGQSKASKKRRREYEVDNVLSTINFTVDGTSDKRDVLIAALDVVDQCMRHTELAPSNRSLANRMLLCILLSLPSIPPSSLSSDPSFHGRVIKKVQNICVECAQGTSHAMNKGTSVVLGSFSSQDLATRDELHSYVDLLLHPRRPPFVRTLPFLESLSLSSAEESAEETATRRSLGVLIGNAEINAISSELPNNLEPVSKDTVDQQIPPNPSQQAPPSSIEVHPQVPRDADGNHRTTTCTVPTVSPLPTLTDGPAGSALLTVLDASTSTACVVPMLVDESDHEEMPAIDLGSDSDV